MNNVLVVDNFLSSEQCQEIVNNCKSLCTDTPMPPPHNYKFYNTKAGDGFLDSLYPKIIELYIEKFPEITHTANYWSSRYFKFKWFPPTYYYSVWHSENGLKTPHRIASILLYLSNNNCGTEFYNGTVVDSKEGRLLVFPSSWTHTHRGQPDPDGKDRFIMSSYLEFVDDNGNFLA